MSKRVEVFDVEGAKRNDPKTGRSSNQLAERKQTAINERIQKAPDVLVDIQEIVLQEPTLSNPGLVQVTLTFEKTETKGGK